MVSFRRKSGQLLGIDISSTSIRLIELTQTLDVTTELYRVEAFAVEPLPANALVEKKIADIDAVGQSIQRAVVRSGSKAKRAAVAVSGSAVITKVIPMMASLSDAEMETQIQLDADQYIPYPLEEVNIDFDVVGRTKGNAEMVDVLLAASRRENVDDRVAALELAGLGAAIVDVEAYAMENAYSLLLGRFDEERHDRTVALVDAGATATTLHVLHDGNTVYTREQNFGGNQLLDEVQRRYGLGRREVLERLDADALPENFEADILGPFKEALAQQITRAMQFFYSASSFSRTDLVILTGGAARFPHIEVVLEERLGLPVTIANPFASMGLAPGIDAKAIGDSAPSMMIATGLALRTFG